MRNALVCLALGVAGLSMEPERAEREGKARRGGRTAPPAALSAAATPSPSAVAAGFDSERVWSAYDDWEPAIGADPSSSYVYR